MDDSVVECVVVAGNDEFPPGVLVYRTAIDLDNGQNRALVYAKNPNRERWIDFHRIRDRIRINNGEKFEIGTSVVKRNSGELGKITGFARAQEGGGYHVLFDDETLVMRANRFFAFETIEEDEEEERDARSGGRRDGGGGSSKTVVVEDDIEIGHKLLQTMMQIDESIRYVLSAVGKNTHKADKFKKMFPHLQTMRDLSSKCVIESIDANNCLELLAGDGDYAIAGTAPNEAARAVFVNSFEEIIATRAWAEFVKTHKDLAAELLGATMAE